MESYHLNNNPYYYQQKNNEMNQPVNMSSTQDSDKNIPVRQLPKKRKFYPSELEEIDKSSTDLNSQKIGYVTAKSPVTVSTSFTSESMQIQQSVVIIPPQSVAVDYSFRESESVNAQPPHSKYVDILCSSRFMPVEDIGRTCEPETVKTINCLPSNVSAEPKKPSGLLANSMYPNTESSPCIDLNEWKDHRILAKQNNLYLPGVIRQANGQNEVWVDLDYCEGKPVKYSNIITTGRFDIISDASPSKGQLTIGTRVCVRKEMKDMMTNIFVEGVICNIINNPMCFVVKVNVNEEVTVKRADLRLLQPPWSDELADMDTDIDLMDHVPNVNVVLRTPGFQDKSNYHSSSVIPGLMLPDQNSVPLQLNQVVPTLQSGNDYYRTTATSPLHLPTPVSHNSACTPLSNGSVVDELRPPQYEDFCESDDDLRREDILFPSEAGK